MARIVTSTYRYKRPPRKRKAVPLEGPAIVRRVKPAQRQPPILRHLFATDGRRSRRSSPPSAGRSRFGDAPDMTPEEHRRRGDAADALFREIVRRSTAKD